MSGALLLMLALSIQAAWLANAPTEEQVAAWRPMYPFIGTWKGTRATEAGAATVTRVYASAATNHHLEITEKGARSRAAVWGIVSLDPQRRVLVLRHFAADGSTSDLTLDSAASTTEQLVFATSETDATRWRIVYERTGSRQFVERIERSTGEQGFELVSETKFVRKD